MRNQLKPPARQEQERVTRVYASGWLSSMIYAYEAGAGIHAG
jgi:hypothetical protein